MEYIKRHAEATVNMLSKMFGAILVAGPRQVGKTTIQVDFENDTAEIIRLADWDTIKTNRFANRAIAYLLSCENEMLPKETMVAFEL